MLLCGDCLDILRVFFISFRRQLGTAVVGDRVVVSVHHCFVHISEGELETSGTSCISALLGLYNGRTVFD